MPMLRRPSVLRHPYFYNFKHPLLPHHLANQSKVLCGASKGSGKRVSLWHLGHKTKMAATPIYSVNPSEVFFSGAGRPISMELGM